MRQIDASASHNGGVAKFVAASDTGLPLRLGAWKKKCRERYSDSQLTATILAGAGAPST